ncbi:MAG: lysyl oxidase family protein [Flavobacteriales bacterium]
MLRKTTLITLLITIFASVYGGIYAQCPQGQVQVQISIIADNFPGETTWRITNTAGNLIHSGNVNGGTYCLPENTCFFFTILDSYGDGICCGFGQGSYTVRVNGEIVAQGGQFTYSETTSINCPPGTSCGSAIEVAEGQYVAPEHNTWYRFVPEITGMYLISTCDIETCNTVIWVYDYCAGLNWDNSNMGTIYYDHNSGGCGDQARVNALLEAGRIYYIRIGGFEGSCNAGNIDWALSFNGPVVGCMNPAACNYNPLATVQGECIFPGDPNCPNGPDLIIVQQTIANSLQVATINASNCHVVEGCLTGYGQRTIIRFTTHIKNIGNQDYYIGAPSANNPQFSWGNCHGHWHHEGYAEYLLYDQNNNAIPIGFKNGFCVIDLECSDGGSAQYGCSNMGISAGCGDIYSSGLDCQWIDVTDVDTGSYTLVVRTNWNHLPDFLGRHELDYMNNWAQVCIRIGLNANGQKTVAVDNDCDPYTDCLGEIYGNAQVDCEGNCAGTKIRGDLNNSGEQNIADAHLYVTGILGNDIAVTPCTDLNLDAKISVYDASLVSSCYLYGEGHIHQGDVPHDHCQFPGGIFNITDTVMIMITGVDFAEKYIDIGILNKHNRVVAYEFDMSGITIANVENTANPDQFPITPQFTLGGNKVIGISWLDSSLVRSPTVQPLCRIHYFQLTNDTVCISRIVDVVNDRYEQTFTQLGVSCYIANTTNLANFRFQTTFDVIPNPTQGPLQIKIGLTDHQEAHLWVTDVLGRQVKHKRLGRIHEVNTTLDLSDQKSGIYLVTLETPSGKISKRIVVQ